MKKIILKFWPIIWIILLWMVFSSPYIFKNLVPFPSRYLADFFPPWNNLYGHPVKNNAMPDVISQIYPWKTLVIDALKVGQVPRWNPHSFSGNPLLAGVQSAPLSPLNLLYFIFPFIDAWSIQVLLQPLISGILMYVFLRSMSRSQSASLFGSISYMFSGFFVVWMAYGTLGYAFLVTPILLYGIEKMYTYEIISFKNNNNRNILNLISPIFFIFIIVFSVIFSLFSGHFQTSLYCVIVGFLYTIYKLLITKNNKRFGVVIASLTVGIVFASVQIIPAIQFYQQSNRSELFQKGEVIPWKYLPTMIAPDFYGNPVTRNDWFGHYAEWASYIGVLPLILSLWFFITKKWQQNALFFLILFACSLFLAFDSIFGNILIFLKIPVLSTSSMSRIIVITSFSLCVLASFGFDLLFIDHKNHLISYRLFAYIPILLIILFCFLFLSFARNLFVMNADQSWIAQKNLLLPIAFSGLLAILVYLYKKIPSILVVIIFIIIGITSFDMYRYASKWMPFDEREFVYPKMNVLDYMKINAGVNRVFGIIGNEALSMNGLYGIEGYDPLYITRYGEFITTATNGKLKTPTRSLVQLDKNGQFTKRILNMLGVRFYFHSKGDGRNIWVFPFWNYLDSFGSPVYSDDYYELYENKKALPRAYITENYTIIKERQRIIDTLFTGSEDNPIVVLEENIPEMQPTNNNLAPRDSIKEALIKTYSANDITVSVHTDNPSILYLSDTWYPGWRALVNDKPAKIYRANYAFRAVYIPVGNVEVRFIYDNWLY
jgi:hypothetical protein